MSLSHLPCQTSSVTGWTEELCLFQCLAQNKCQTNIYWIEYIRKWTQKIEKSDSAQMRFPLTKMSLLPKTPFCESMGIGSSKKAQQCLPQADDLNLTLESMWTTQMWWPASLISVLYSDLGGRLGISQQLPSVEYEGHDVPSACYTATMMHCAEFHATWPSCIGKNTSFLKHNPKKLPDIAFVEIN